MVETSMLLWVFGGHAFAGDAVPVRLAAANVALDDAAHAATTAQLLGASCSFTTGMMARRVVDQGVDWQMVGRLGTAPLDAESQVATPFTLAEDGAVRIIATDLLETVVTSGHVAGMLTLSGRMLDVDGTRYVVLTSFQAVEP